VFTPISKVNSVVGLVHSAICRMVVVREMDMIAAPYGGGEGAGDVLVAETLLVVEGALEAPVWEAGPSLVVVRVARACVHIVRLPKHVEARVGFGVAQGEDVGLPPLLLLTLWITRLEREGVAAVGVALGGFYEALWFLCLCLCLHKV